MKIVGRLSSAEAEGTLGQYALMVKPTRAFLFRSSAAAWRGFNRQKNRSGD
jgi:hypothetical protein